MTTAAFGAESGTLEFTDCAAGERHTEDVIVLDLTRGVTAANASETAYLIGRENHDLIDKLDTLLRACPEAELADVRLFITQLRNANLSKRLISHAGDHVTIYAFVVGTLVNVKIEEKRRETLLRQDIGDLIDMLKRVRAAGGFAGAKARIQRADYMFVEPRATVAISVMPFADVPGGEPAEKEPIKVAEILTGSAEHFRLSANVPVNSVKLVDYDQTSRQPILKDTPREFMLGFDWFLGDVLSTPAWHDWRRLGLKGLVRFSKQPLDGLGLMAAYRLGSIQILAGPTWTRTTSKVGVNADGSDQLKKSYQSAWRAGLGFDLKTASKWLTEKKDGTGK